MAQSPGMNRRENDDGEWTRVDTSDAGEERNTITAKRHDGRNNISEEYKGLAARLEQREKRATEYQRSYVYPARPRESIPVTQPSADQKRIATLRIQVLLMSNVNKKLRRLALEGRNNRSAQETYSAGLAAHIQRLEQALVVQEEKTATLQRELARVNAQKEKQIDLLKQQLQQQQQAQQQQKNQQQHRGPLVPTVFQRSLTEHATSESQFRQTQTRLSPQLQQVFGPTPDEQLNDVLVEGITRLTW